MFHIYKETDQMALNKRKNTPSIHLFEYQQSLYRLRQKNNVSHQFHLFLVDGLYLKKLGVFINCLVKSYVVSDRQIGSNAAELACF